MLTFTNEDGYDTLAFVTYALLLLQGESYS